MAASALPRRPRSSRTDSCHQPPARRQKPVGPPLKRSIETNASSDYPIAPHSWAVASMTESEPGVESEKPPTSPLVDRDSATRRARRLDVQSDVGELCFISEKRS